MKEIQELPHSPYRGSEMTLELVREQIRERYGDEAADSFNPRKDCRPYNNWLDVGFRVRRGEKAIRSITFVEAKGENGEVVNKIRRTVFLFYKDQVEPVE